MSHKGIYGRPRNRKKYEQAQARAQQIYAPQPVSAGEGYFKYPKPNIQPLISDLGKKPAPRERTGPTA